MSRSSDLIERHWDITSKLAGMIEFLLLQFNVIPFPKSVAGGSRPCAKGGGGSTGLGQAAVVLFYLPSQFFFLLSFLLFHPKLEGPGPPRAPPLDPPP